MAERNEGCRFMVEGERKRREEGKEGSLQSRDSLRGDAVWFWLPLVPSCQAASRNKPRYISAESKGTKSGDETTTLHVRAKRGPRLESIKGLVVWSFLK